MRQASKNASNANVPSSPYHFHKPEQRNHPAFQGDKQFTYYKHLTGQKPLFRHVNWFLNNIILARPVDELLDKYAQRTNSVRLFGVLLAGFYLGTVIFYLRYKIQVQEKKLA